MKSTIRNHWKMALLAVASAALLTPVVHGQTISPQFDELILGFRAGSNPGQTLNLEVDLGSMIQFYEATPGSEIALPGLKTADLVATYGANWYTRIDLYWGAVGTAGRITGWTSNAVTVGTATLWATAPNCGAAWNKASLTSQKNASSKIEPMIVAGSPGTLYGATPTANSASAAVIDATQAGSWTVQDTGVAGTSFGFFNPSIDNYEGTNIVVSQLYELQPGSGAGTYLGDLILRNTGLSFRKAAPTAAICHGSVMVAADGSCQGSVTVDDIDNGSTGLCLTLALDATGPFPIGTTNVTLTVTDASGATDSCTASVTVAGAAPTVSSTANINQCNPVVTWATPTATGCNTPIGAVVCTPASGSTFSTGATTVHCTATDGLSLVGSNSFTVTISGGSVTVDCSGLAVVTNVVNATDTSIVYNYTTPTGSSCAGAVNVVCSPASGSTFNVGTTTVTCTGTDPLSNSGTCSFTVKVNGAGITGITGQVNALTDAKMTAGRKTSLDGALTRAQADLNAFSADPTKTSKLKQACGQLKSFIIRVTIYKRLGIINATDADALLAAANAAKASNGCP